ncbi:MAG TPA: ORF6N domain-containing protein [Bdellovibrionota bacterium]|nr:ORF6N domain-containing protein [Bdellovibrionota bacterium]
MLTLTREEFDSLRCQFGTSKTGRGGARNMPFAFTEQGVQRWRPF